VIGLNSKNRNKLAMLLVGPSPIDIWALKALMDQLPNDCVMVGITSDFKSARWGWVFASEEFQEIPEGALIPEIIATFDGVKRTAKITKTISPRSFSDALKDL
jgi:hypothetical protein